MADEQSVGNGSITIRRSALAKRRLGRSELKHFCDWNDDRPETGLNFKFYRQATNKIAGNLGSSSGIPPRILDTTRKPRRLVHNPAVLEQPQ
jgi:hypothetical protein